MVSTIGELISGLGNARETAGRARDTALGLANLAGLYDYAPGGGAPGPVQEATPPARVPDASPPAPAPTMPVQQALDGIDPLTYMKQKLPEAIAGMVRMQAELPENERDPQALLAALATGSQTLTRLTDLEKTGRAQMSDGSYITMGDLKSADPAIRAQATAAMFKLGQQSLKDGNMLLQMAGLDPIPGMDGGSGEAAARASYQDFQNRMAQLDAKVALDKLNLSRSAAETERNTAALAESRGRASTITQRLIEAAPYDTGGRTMFGGGDLGALPALRLRQAGLENPEAIPNIVQYPGSQRIDPQGLMQAYDAQLGGGAFAPIPSLLSGAGDIPGLPAVYAGP